MNEFAGKQVLVLGAGISGISVAETLCRLGASVTLNDSKTEEAVGRDFSHLRELGIKLALGKQDETLLADLDIVILSPGISIYNPLVAAASARGILVMSEVEVAYRLCPAPIVAITGTNGKTTTTTLVGEMLRAAGADVVVGGNIGLALSHEVKGVDNASIVVAEISSFQLEGVSRFRPHIAAILNLTPDHIDRHRTMENYQSMKERIFANQTGRDYTILNYDDAIVRSMSQRTAAQVVYFSRQQELPSGVFLRDGVITVKWQEETVTVCPVSEMKIFGDHNVENALAACACAYFAGANHRHMAQVLKTFAGVEHRIEPVATVNGVPYFNDSKATNPESSIKALEAFPGKVILIAGGRDKNTDLTEFMTLIKAKVDHLILLGEAKSRFMQAAQQQGVNHIHQVDSLEDGVTLAHRLAVPPQVVLLSPACASYDMFNNYEERGRSFKRLVCSLA
jgi:UDP-N-acetylmuramoylalanine--D-glutamate ligase